MVYHSSVFLRLTIVVWLFSLSVSAAAPFLLSKTFGDYMLLQADIPNTLWGFGVPGSTVTVTFDGKTLSPSVTTGTDGIWRQLVPPQSPDFDVTVSHNFSLTSSDGPTLALNYVKFGILWACGGQSNMAFSVNQCFNATEEVQESNMYENYIRIFTVGGQGNSSYPFVDLETVQQPWAIGNNLTIGDFSAVCYFFARDLLRYWNSTANGIYNSSFLPPIGLISNNVGGTAIELWSSSNDLEACYTEAPNSAPYGPPYVNGSLYNGMIMPYATGPTSIGGWLFYQSEANAPPYQHAPEWYACLFPRLITNWRMNIFNSVSPSTMPFLFVQIAPFNGTDGWEDIRQAQLSGYTDLAHVGFGTMVDNGDPGSPFGTYHPRNKQLIGQRLANTALSMVYNAPTSIRWIGPMIQSVSFTTASGGTVGVATASFVPDTVPVEGLKYVPQTCPATIPISICSDFSLFFQPAPPPTYNYLGEGFLAAGDDCGNGVMTVAEAYVNCTANPVCVGFTFTSNASDPSVPVNILFKSSLNYFASTGWQAYGSDRDVRGVRVNATGVINSDNTITLSAPFPAGTKEVTAAAYAWSTWPLTPIYSNDAWNLPMIPWYVENHGSSV